MDIASKLEAVAQKAHAMVLSRHRPKGHPHPSMWDARYISGSRVVKDGAADIAQHLIDERNGAAEPYEDNFKGFWSLRGDSFHHATFPPEDNWISDTEGLVTIAVPVEATPENEDVLRDLTGHSEFVHGKTYYVTWKLAIHPDSLQIIDGIPVVGESKAFNANDIQRETSASRQGALGLAALQHTAREFYDRDDVQKEEKLLGFYPVEYDKDGIKPNTAEPCCVWPKDTLPCGVVLTSIVEWEPMHPDSPTLLKVQTFTEDQLNAILDYYIQKCIVIVRSAINGSTEEAFAWQTANAAELARNPDEMFNVEQDVWEAAAQVKHWGTVEKEAKSKKKAAADELVFAMEQAGLRKTGKQPEGSITIVEYSGSRRASVGAVDEALNELDALEEAVAQGFEGMGEAQITEALNIIRSKLTGGISQGAPYLVPRVKVNAAPEAVAE